MTTTTHTALDVTFRPESLARVWDEALALAPAHWDQAGHPECAFRLDRSLYERMEEAGALRLFTVREDATARLLGYASFFVGPHPHSAVLQASQDALYLMPEARQGWTALSFLRFLDAQLAAAGVDLILQHAGPTTALAVLLRRRKYHLHAELYAKRVEHG